ncbi:MAG TPA: AMP-binding protein [Pseudobdellovibrionaceae bacterium]|nr:AMP-binding protein [Pseudobdellovibrionaceae bacterium]
MKNQFVNWESQTNDIFLNPSLDLKTQNSYKSLIENSIQQTGLKGHIWLATSGTTNQGNGGLGKCVALSKQSFLNSAVAVGQHLDVTKKDIWGLVLPQYHVGGLSIKARCFVSGQKCEIYTQKWSASLFSNFLSEYKITLTSLVPTQVYDLIAQKIKSPAPLRAVVVGGASLSESLYIEARKLGWPLLPSYGMTETASQVATASLSSLESVIYPQLRVLNHAQLRIVEENQIESTNTNKSNRNELNDELIQIKCSSLLTGYAYQNEFIDPKIKGWFKTEDRGELSVDPKLKNVFYIKLLGRSSDYIKIKGEGVSKPALENMLNEILVKDFPQWVGKCYLQSVFDERSGNKMILIAELSSVGGEGIDGVFKAKEFESLELQKIKNKFNERVLNHEQIQEISPIDSALQNPSFKRIL